MKDRRSYIKEDQAHKIINYFYEKGKFHHINKAYLIYTLWRTGRRISEIVGNPPYTRIHGLRPMDFNEQDKIITFSILKKMPVRKKDKSGKERSKDNIEKDKHNKKEYAEEIAVDDQYFSDMIEYISVLKETKNMQDHHIIFPYHRIYVDQIIKKAARDLNLFLGSKKVLNKTTGLAEEIKMPVNAHSFRHGFSMNFLKKNDTNPRALPALQEILCHSNINVTKSYLKFDQKDKRDMLNKVFVGAE